MKTKKQSGTIQGITCPSCGVFTPNVLSNDNLVKARYDMYEALKALEKHVKSHYWETDTARQLMESAISKAEGK